MAETKVDNAKETAAAKLAANADAAVEKKVSGIAEETKKSAEAATKTAEAPKTGDTAKPTEAKPKPESSTEPSNVRHNDSTHDAPKKGAHHEPFPHARTTVIGSLAAMTALGPSVISQIPLIGKIPYLAQASGWLQSGLSSLTTPLGLGTGTNATNAFMASLPTGMGPAAAVALGIPTALWGIGLTKALITGDKTERGYWGHVSQATKLISQMPFMPYHFAMKARVKTGEMAQSVWNTAKKPFAGAWNLAGKIAKSAWNTTAATTSAALTPTKWGIGGALLGVALSGGTAAAIPVTAGLGYGIMNYLKNTGALDPKEGGSDSGKK